MRSTQTPSNLYFDGYATQVILQNDLGTHGVRMTDKTFKSGNGQNCILPF